MKTGNRFCVHTLLIIIVIVCSKTPQLSTAQEPGKPLARVRAAKATGPLRINPANPRYFTDDSGRAIYLTGSHTWANMLDRGHSNPPAAAFDYDKYMKWMVDHNFNFMRLWTAELTNAGGPDYSEGNFVAGPWKWVRTGPGLADDGGMKFDLSKLDQNYFDRMRKRTITAGENGIYIAIMLFNAYEWQFDTNPKDGDPFVGTNNINGINCPVTCPTDNAEISDTAWNIETAYFRKVVDTVNDLDNVLYEVANEAGSPYSDTWQIRVIEYLKEYEASKPKHHPVGMTFQWQGGSDLTLYNSPADWISPGSHVPPSDGHKVIINDTDHAFGYVEFKNRGQAAQRAWVWENFTSGNNVAFMDPYLTKWPNRNSPAGNTADPNVGTAPDTYWDVIRDAMGPTLTYANRMKLQFTKPQPTLSTTGFCLANPGTEYLVYQPVAKPFTLQLAPGTYQFEWFNPDTNLVGKTGSITASGREQSFTAPFPADAVLYLSATGK
jgi:hypothetical protein